MAVKITLDTHQETVHNYIANMVRITNSHYNILNSSELRHLIRFGDVFPFNNVVTVKCHFETLG